jgi:hypothetical protein
MKTKKSNKVKSEFDQKEMDFLKHILLREGVSLTLGSCKP